MCAEWARQKDSVKKERKPKNMYHDVMDGGRGVLGLPPALASGSTIVHILEELKVSSNIRE
jgi:hypothetical protein